MTQRFELIEKIGSGGMGAVWKARDTETNEVVALKLVHAHLAEDPDYIVRFEREVEVARRIDSPYVVKVLGYGTREGVPYMAMEYVEGQSLRDLLRANGPMNWEQAKPLVRQVAEALGAAHEVGVIHRDVKPSNILITTGGTAKLADFGIARALDLTRLTGSSTMLGTPHYMAPEGTASPQSDLYALGCVMFEMLTGHPPFEGDSQQAVLIRHIGEPPLTSGVPTAALPFIDWLLAKSPAARPPSAPALLQSLEDAQVPRIPNGRPRRPLLAFAASAVTVLMLGGVVGLMESDTAKSGAKQPLQAQATSEPEAPYGAPTTSQVTVSTSPSPTDSALPLQTPTGTYQTATPRSAAQDPDRAPPPPPPVSTTAPTTADPVPTTDRGSPPPTAAAPNSAPVTMDDDFNDGIVSARLWTPVYRIGPAGTPSQVGLGRDGAIISEADGRLLMSSPGGQVVLALQSKCVVSGDFDARVDFALLVWPRQSLASVRLFAGMLPSGSIGHTGVYRLSYQTEVVQFRSQRPIAEISTQATTGTLRLVRSGETISGYLDGALIGTATTSLDTTSISIDLGGYPDNLAPPVVPLPLEVAFDNFMVSGSVKC